MKFIKITIIISLLLALTWSVPVQAANTVLTVVTTQDNVPASIIPAVAFAHGAVATSDGSIPATITFSGGSVSGLVSLPDTIDFAGGDESNAASAMITIPADMPANAPDHALEIDGVAVNLGTDPKIDMLIADTIANYAGFSSKDYTVARPGGTANVVFTRKNVGAEGNAPLTIQDPDYSSVNSNSAIAHIDINKSLYGGDPYDHLIIIDGISINLGDSAQNEISIANTIAGEINLAGKDYTAAVLGSSVTLTKNTPGEAGNADITASDHNYTSLGPVAASAEITVPSGILAASLDRALTIDGVTINLEAGDLTADQIAADIAAGNFSAKDYVVASLDDTATFTKKNAGPAGNVTLTNQDANYGAIAQIVTITPENSTVGETVTITINDIDYDYVIQTGDTAADVVSGLKTAITNPDVTASGTDTLILTANIPGTTFTVGDTIIDAPPPPTQTATKIKKKKDSKLSGYVKEQNTLIPIAGASVKVYTKGGTRKGSTKTDKNGKYSFGNLYSGKYIVRISAVGFVNPSHPERPTISHHLRVSGSTYSNGYFLKTRITN